ncbi:MAG: aminotransferase class V-fold PLP-dependent enzyme [Acidobacteria bacterium]|nr:aminotransferase class V-fold PLP-dependent enzyme [Acidobacteriota bacterium]
MVRIYLDHNATTPVDAEVVDAMSVALRDHFGNPSSIHAFGQQAKTALDEARDRVAALVGASPSDIVFTGGGTEGDNLALRGLSGVPALASRRHIVISAIEHEAVRNTAHAMAKLGWRVAEVPVGRLGVVEPDDLRRAIQPDTAIVAVMHANNEIGTIQPVAALARIAHDAGALFHADAVQSAGRIPVDVVALGVDMLAISAHKFGGPKGVGAMWLRRGLGLTSILTGGRQERGRRAGTENVPGLVGLGVAARSASRDLVSANGRIAAMRDRLESGILEGIPGATVNGDRERRLPNTTNISFDAVEGESLVIALDLEGIAVSTGSACSSGTLEPSHVLRALGLPASRVQSAIRFSLGRSTTEDEIERTLDILPRVVARIRGRGGQRLRPRDDGRM